MTGMLTDGRLRPPVPLDADRQAAYTAGLILAGIAAAPLYQPNVAFDATLWAAEVDHEVRPMHGDSPRRRPRVAEWAAIERLAAAIWPAEVVGDLAAQLGVSRRTPWLQWQGVLRQVENGLRRRVKATMAQMAPAGAWRARLYTANGLGEGVLIEAADLGQGRDLATVRRVLDLDSPEVEPVAAHHLRSLRPARCGTSWWTREPCVFTRTARRMSATWSAGRRGPARVTGKAAKAKIAPRCEGIRATGLRPDQISHLANPNGGRR